MGSDQLQLPRSRPAPRLRPLRASETPRGYVLIQPRKKGTRRLGKAKPPVICGSPGVLWVLRLFLFETFMLRFEQEPLSKLDVKQSFSPEVRPHYLEQGSDLNSGQLNLLPFILGHTHTCKFL